MEVSRRNFPEILLDNDNVFLEKLIGVIESVDELACMQITMSESKMHFRIAPSVYKYMEPILYEILNFSNMFGLKLDLGKSMKATSTVEFAIDL
jgi:hypothetical protein